MKLTLIKPTLGQILKHPEDAAGRPYIDQARMEPLQLAVIAGLTPPDVEVVMYDDRLEDIPYEEPTDLVAITVETFTAKRAYEIADEYRKRHVHVILGGIHPSMVPKESSQYADSICIGDAEFVWADVIDDAREGHLKPLYHSRAGCPQKGTFPRKDIFEGKEYLPINLIQFGRGCKYTCNYCITSVYFNAKCYYRSVDEVVREIQSQKKRLFFFVDDNIVADMSLAKELFRALIPLKIKWVGQASIDMTKDPELMDLMQKSGCLGHVVGFEAVTESGLIGLNKSPNLTSFGNYKEEIKIIKDYGLNLWAAFVLGHDEDRVETIAQTLDFALHNKFWFAAYNVLMPYPKTPLYQKLETENRLLFNGKWWLDPDYRFNHAAFIPKHMTTEELTIEAFKIRKKWNSIGSIVKRCFNVKANMTLFRSMAAYVFYNNLFRKEVFKKQSMKLGIEN